MSRDFDEIVGSDAEDAERLRRVHELLVAAGPPPELPPRLREAPVAESNVLSLPRLPARRRTTLLFAAALLVLSLFFGGYLVGHARFSSAQAVNTLSLRGTKSASHAFASLQIFPLRAGNWPMTLTVSDLPKLPAHSYYEVYLVRRGTPYLSCGEFTVAGGSIPVTVQLNAPYVFRPGDTWVVTRQTPGTEPGKTVMRPVAA